MEGTDVIDAGRRTDGDPSDRVTPTGKAAEPPTWTEPMSSTEGKLPTAAQPDITNEVLLNLTAVTDSTDDPRDLDRHAGRILSTGELRGRLQRSIPLKMRAPVLGLDGEFHFKDGDTVMSQYWGAGIVMLTPMRLEAGPPIAVVAHDIRAELY